MQGKFRNKKKQKPRLHKLNWNVKRKNFNSSRLFKLNNNAKFKNNRPKSVSLSRNKPSA